MFRCTDETADTKVYPYHIRDVHISDPYILADAASGRYYTYVQFVDSQRFPDVPAGPGYFYVLESQDLIHWSEPRVCFEKGSFLADRDYWAPECHIWQGKYYLISSFRAEGSYRRCLHYKQQKAALNDCLLPNYKQLKTNFALSESHRVHRPR